MQTAQSLAPTRQAHLDLARTGFASLAAAMLLCAFGFVLVRIATPSDGTAGAYVTSSWTSGGLGVQLLPGADGALRDGDVVVGVAGRPLATWLDDTFNPSTPRPPLNPGVTVEYAVERGGESRIVPVRIAAYPLADTLLANWSTLVGVLTMGAVGIYLFLRRPSEPAARALLVMGVGVFASSIPWMLGLGPIEVVAGGAGTLLFLAATFGVYLLFWSAIVHFSLVFPAPIASGPRQRRLVVLAYAVPLLVHLAWALATLPLSENALGWIGAWTRLQTLTIVAIVTAALLLLVLQWRRAGPEERSRLRWISRAAAASAGVVLLGWFLPQAVTGEALLPWSAIGVAGLAFPVAIGMAVSRHALFGIETVLHRSLVYGGLTAGIVATYVATVMVVRFVLPGDGFYAEALLATGLAALIALPLRDRLQRGASRLVYGDRDDPYRAIARLGARLESSLQPSAVLPMVAETVAESLRLPYAAIELQREGGAAVAAAHGTPRGSLERLPLVHQGEEVGWLVLAPRGPDEPFSASDRALLGDLARQAGAAAYAARLTAELQRSRQQLVAAREEERRRLRRELHDGVGPALAGSLMKLGAARGLARKDPEAVERLLAELARETRQNIDDVRRAAYDLRPPALDQLGLVAALEQEAARLAPPDASFAVMVAGPLPELPAAVEVAAYRIGLEALTNVAHHAAASAAWLELRAADEELVIEVRDDGRGPQAAAHAGVGMSSMRERAEELGGTFEATRAPEGGMRIHARLPIATPLGHA